MHVQAASALLSESWPLRGKRCTMHSVRWPTATATHVLLPSPNSPICHLKLRNCNTKWLIATYCRHQPKMCDSSVTMRSVTPSKHEKSWDSGFASQAAENCQCPGGSLGLEPGQWSVGRHYTAAVDLLGCPPHVSRFARTQANPEPSAKPPSSASS